MEQKKYELTEEKREWCGRTLHRIRALRDFQDVKAGELGGWVESEKNLAQEGDAWVYGNAWVSGNARVYGDARVSGNARVYGNAQVYGDARVSSYARVYGDARVYGNASIIWIGNIGSRADTTTFFACRDGKIGVKCGCFSGDIQQFEEAVRDTHGDSQYGKEYMAAIALAKAKIGGNDGAVDI